MRRADCQHQLSFSCLIIRLTNTYSVQVERHKRFISTYDSPVRRFHRNTNDIYCRHNGEKCSSRCRTGTAYEHYKLQHSYKATLVNRPGNGRDRP